MHAHQSTLTLKTFHCLILFIRGSVDVPVALPSYFSEFDTPQLGRVFPCDQLAVLWIPCEEVTRFQSQTMIDSGTAVRVESQCRLQQCPGVAVRTPKRAVPKTINAQVLKSCRLKILSNGRIPSVSKTRRQAIYSNGHTLLFQQTQLRH